MGTDEILRLSLPYAAGATCPHEASKDATTTNP